jgi:flagellum-specific peptidoglycan hydrolase FlgJ
MKYKVISIFILLSFMIINNLNSYSREFITPNYELTYSELLFVIDLYDIKHKDIVFAQALIESGHFSSKVFINNKNLFGMRFPRKRETTAIHEENGYAYYESWVESVKDYKLWQQAILKNNPNISKEQYLNILGNVYAEAPNYVAVIKKIIH